VEVFDPASTRGGQLLSDLHSYLITRDQANSAGDNKKIHNKNCDKARTCVELGWKGGIDLCYKNNQQNQVQEHHCKEMETFL
jgi:hypothetical protein